MNTPPSSSPSGSTPCPATDAANAPVGIQPRQRATSSDSIPGAKRSKFNSYPPPHLSLDLDLESATLEHWRHSAATTPSDDALEAAADQFEQSLAALEDSSSWGSSFSSTPSSLASETSVALAASSRVQGVRTNLPTPSATPQSTSYQAYDHASPATLHSRPPHLRSSTLPLASSKSLTAKALARATALAAGVMGSEREIQAGGPVEVISSVPGSSMLGLGMPERRSSDPTPQPVEALSSKERFVAGLVGESESKTMGGMGADESFRRRVCSRYRIHLGTDCRARPLDSAGEQRAASPVVRQGSTSPLPHLVLDASTRPLLPPQSPPRHSRRRRQSRNLPPGARPTRCASGYHG